MNNGPKRTKRWTLPTAVTWDEAKKIATGRGARLLQPLEADQWSQEENLNVDFWLDWENKDAPSYACYWDGTKQQHRYQPKDRLALVVMLVDVDEFRKLRAEAEQKAQKGQSTRKISRKHRY